MNRAPARHLPALRIQQLSKTTAALRGLSVLFVDLRLDQADVELSSLPQDGNRDIDRALLEEQIDLTERELEIQEPEIGEKRREDGPIDRQHPSLRIDREAQAALQQVEDHARCPRPR